MDDFALAAHPFGDDFDAIDDHWLGSLDSEMLAALIGIRTNTLGDPQVNFSVRR
jgi:hypothetical protein